MTTPRLVRYVRTHFPDRADELLVQLETLIAELGLKDRERIPLAVLLASEHRTDGLDGALRLARIDWRDVLVQGELAQEDWRVHVDQILGGAEGDQSVG